MKTKVMVPELPKKPPESHLAAFTRQDLHGRADTIAQNVRVPQPEQAKISL